MFAVEETRGRRETRSVILTTKFPGSLFPPLVNGPLLGGAESDIDRATVRGRPVSERERRGGWDRERSNLPWVRQKVVRLGVHAGVRVTEVDVENGQKRRRERYAGVWRATESPISLSRCERGLLGKIVIARKGERERL